MLASVHPFSRYTTRYTTATGLKKFLMTGKWLSGRSSSPLNRTRDVFAPPALFGVDVISAVALE